MTDPAEPPLPPGYRAARLRITGHVQGVWYRGWMMEQAARLNLRGWVRNRKDGSVEALVVGPASLVQEIIGLCAEGPAAARVERIVVDDAQGITPDDFRQMPTV